MYTFPRNQNNSHIKYTSATIISNLRKSRKLYSVFVNRTSFPTVHSNIIQDALISRINH